MKDNSNNFYNRIFSWHYFIRNGYFDFQEINKNNLEDLLSYEYGKDDVIDPNFFNLDSLLESSVLEYIKDFPFLHDDGKFKPTNPIIFTIPKDVSVRRVLKFPNLYSFFALVKLLINSKDEIIDSLNGDTNSTSKYFNIKPYKFERTMRIKNSLLLGYSKFYKTDFVNFYHSFYTHVIPWILYSKKEAKRSRGVLNLGNKLDKVIESQQDMQTHGLPTGDLPTRIVVEYFMSFIDKEIRDRLGNDISFHRYVDDFIFGFNSDKDLLKIKRVLYDISLKYEISLNSTKTAIANYNKLQITSALIGGLDNVDIENISIKRLNTAFNNLLISAFKEENLEVKGSLKIVFSVIMYFVEDLRNSADITKFFKSLIYRESKDEATFIEQLFQQTLIDSKLSLYFIRLLRTIEKKKGYLVVNYLRKKYRATKFKQLMFNKAKNSLENGNNQEAYTILTLYSTLGVSFTQNQLVKLFKTIDSQRFDDFSFSILLQMLIEKIDTEKINEQNLIKILIALHDGLKTDSFPNKYFIDEHWLLRYTLFYLYKNNALYQKAVKKFYNSGKVSGSKILDYERFKSNGNKDEVSEFYYDLLEKYNVSFSKINDTYGSSDL